MSHVAIASPQQVVPIDRARMRQLVQTVLEGEGLTEAEVSLAFVDDATIHRLNKQYLNHDEPTDVLSFPLAERGRVGGELVVGVEVAVREALARGHGVEVELALYVIHGLLHLCGYDDTTPEAAAQMRQRQQHYLRQLGLPESAA